MAGDTRKGSPPKKFMTPYADDILATPTASVSNTGARATNDPAAKDMIAQLIANSRYDFNMGATQNVSPHRNIDDCGIGTVISYMSYN